MKASSGIDMIERITVGFDGSAASCRAIEWAAGEAEVRHVEVDVVACFAAPEARSPWYSVVPIDIDSVRIETEHQVAVALGDARASHPTVNFTWNVVLGRPRTALVKAAAGSDLLVIGTTGAAEIESRQLGSVSRAVARTSPCPVVLVPDRVPPPPHARLVVGVDARPDATRALDWALAEADRREADLMLVHAWRYPYGVPSESSAGRDVTRLDAALVLDAALEYARDATNRRVEGCLAEERPAAALIQSAATADLVVLGSKRRGPVRNAVLGSVGHDVSAGSPAPVVIVHDPQR